MADVKICCSYTELVNTDKLVAHPKNPNKHPERQIIISSSSVSWYGNGTSGLSRL